MRQVERELEFAGLEAVGVDGDAKAFKPGFIVVAGLGFITFPIVLAVSVMEPGGVVGSPVFRLVCGLLFVACAAALVRWMIRAGRTMGSENARARGRLAQLRAELARIESAQR